MRNPHISEVTNPFPGQNELAVDPARSGIIGRMAGRVASRETVGRSPKTVDLDMNVATTYGIEWDAEKCGRDALQNFFDANDGTLDGVSVDVSSDDEVLVRARNHTVVMTGGGSYDFRDLAVIGATTKSTGGNTAGGFGEGAKFLALSLLRDHGAGRVIYRSRDWQLEFFIGDMPADKVARPTKGLFARVATGLKSVEGSSMVVTTRNVETAQALLDAKKLFRSSENPDFKDNTVVKTLSDGSQAGIKFLGLDNYNSRKPTLNSGHLYIAGQRRHYSAHGKVSESWDTVEGLSVWTTKDIASGDRDRGQISRDTLSKQLLHPLVDAFDAEDIKVFFTAIEPAYAQNILGGRAGYSELTHIGDLAASRGQKLGVVLEFDPKYVAVSPFQNSAVIRSSLEEAGYVLCPHYFNKIGMKSDKDVLRILHEHQRIEPTPEQQGRIGILQEALTILTAQGKLKQEIPAKEIWLYSKKHEKNPFEGTYDEEFVWLSEEHLGKDFATVFATHLHELNHKHGTDQSAEFSYALTDTLAEVIHAITTNPDISEKFRELAKRWEEFKVELEEPNDTTANN